MIWFLLKQLYPSRGTVLDTYLDASRLGLSTTTVLVYSTTTSPSGDSCILFTSEGRQARVSYEQNGFRVVCNRNTKRRNFTINEEAVPYNTKKATKFDLAVFGSSRLVKNPLLATGTSVNNRY